MATSYAETIQLVRNWVNRDTSALPDTIIMDGMRWAADKAYRTLRVPPLEQTYDYESLILDSSDGTILPIFRFPIPGDLIEFILIRELTTTGTLVTVFNEKADVRTFRDDFAEKYNDQAYWTRERGNVLLRGFGLSANSRVQLYYYRRLPALNARFDVTTTNWLAGRLNDIIVTDNPNTSYDESSDLNTRTATTTLTLTYTSAPLRDDDPDDRTFFRFTVPATSNGGGIVPVRGADFGDPTTMIVTTTDNNGVMTVRTEDPVYDMVNNQYTVTFATALPDGTTLTVTDAIDLTDYYGLYVPHWLRDENQRIILFGALAECFAYLQEDDQAQKYGSLFYDEIRELNDEDKMRDASGGNVQINFNGRGLI